MHRLVEVGVMSDFVSKTRMEYGMAKWALDYHDMDNLCFENCGRKENSNQKPW